jgi:hypothetical protein
MLNLNENGLIGGVRKPHLVGNGEESYEFVDVYHVVLV